MKPFAITTFFAAAAILMAVQSNAQGTDPIYTGALQDQVHGVVMQEGAADRPADRQGHPVSQPAGSASYGSSS